MKHIHITMRAYNAGRTIGRAVDSLLKQTYGDFTLYILDNGSKDNTRALINQYAKQDKRIVVFYNKENHRYNARSEKFLNLPLTIPEEDLWANLDSDDAYYPTFLADALALMTQHELDIVAVGSDFVQAQTGELIGRRALGQTLVLNKNDIPAYFPQIHQFFRVQWGKLMRAQCIRAFADSRSINDRRVPDYGRDTWNMFTALKRAERIGVIQGTHHQYTVSPKSASQRLTAKRILSDRLLFQQAHDFLSQLGPVSPRNEDFLLGVYLNALTDTLKVVINAPIALSEKMTALHDMLFCGPTQQLAEKADFGQASGTGPQWQEQRSQLFQAILAFMMKAEEIPDHNVPDFCDMGELLSETVNDAAKWLFFRKIRIAFYHEQGQLELAKELLDELLELLPGEAELMSWRAEMTS